MRQTSVLISDTAWEALEQVAGSWALPRDAAVRRLLTGFVQRQSAIVEDRRLTHISTVLNHPLCLELSLEKPPRRRLKFRILPAAGEEAVSLTYRIPGRARRQAHRDYASRPLTDALLTALALEQPFIDVGLEGLPDLLEWREADGLWRLTVAATLTASERTARSEGHPDLRAMLEDLEVVWHSQWRAQVARHLAQHLFTGPDAEENRRWVGEQRNEFVTEVTNLSDPRVVFGGHEYTDGAPEGPSSAEGRAATAIWRCKRLIAQEAFARWLTREPPAGAEETITPPNWTLRQPTGWFSRRLPTQELIPQAQHLVDGGALLRITSGSTSTLWPLTKDRRAVPGFERVVAGARQLHFTPIEIAEAVLVSRSERDPDEDEVDHLGVYPVLPIETAFEAGLVDVNERDRLVREAQDRTSLRIANVLRTAEREKYPEDELKRLREAKDDPQAFGRVAADLDPRFQITVAVWTWEVRSVLEFLAQEATPEQVELRGREWCRHVRLALERDMQRAWHEAMWDVITARADDY